LARNGIELAPSDLGNCFVAEVVPGDGAVRHQGRNNE